MLIPTMEIVLSAAAAALAIKVLNDSVEQDSDCDDFVVEMMELGAILWARDEPKARIRGYVEEVVPMYLDNDFRKHFRITQSVFDVLLAKVCTWGDVCSNLMRGGRRPISLDKRLLITLWYLGCGESFRQIADRFGVSESSAHSTVRRICTGLLLHLRKVVITWPCGMRFSEVKTGFKAIKGFPNVIGAIDGCHIPIKPPSDDRDSYINRKKFPSLLLQAVCDHQMCFVDCYCGWPGSVHDARVLRNSDLFNRALSHPAEVFPEESHILGDAAYPLKLWLLTPYRDKDILDQKKGNITIFTLQLEWLLSEHLPF